MSLDQQYQKTLTSQLEQLSQLMLRAIEKPRNDETLQALHALSHRMHGTAGVYGYDRESRFARNVEIACKKQILDGSGGLSALRNLHRAFDWECPPRPKAAVGTVFFESDERAAPIAVRSAPTVPLVLIIDDDDALVEQFADLARRSAVDVARVHDVENAVKLVREENVIGIVVDYYLGNQSGIDTALALRDHAELCEIPLAFISVDDSTSTRLACAHVGGMYFLEKPLAPRSVARFLSRLQAFEQNDNVRILVVDDDLQFGERLANWLEGPGWQAFHLQDPSMLLVCMDEVRPDLVILDIYMPELSGIECCRLIRTSEAWSDLPILMITADSDPETQLAAFEAGADDFVGKPILKEKLLARVSARLERLQLLRRQAQFDSLTGLFNRSAFLAAWELRVKEADRTETPLAVCLMDMDHFKRINTGYGHTAGDDVLRMFGQRLQSRFRAQDLRCRWGGEEFLVVLAGEDAANGAALLNRFLQEFSAIDFTSPKGDFSASFSAGIAAYPFEGRHFDELLALADERLLEAKRQGRKRIIHAGSVLRTQKRPSVVVVARDRNGYGEVAEQLQGIADTRGATSTAAALQQVSDIKPAVVLVDRVVDEQSPDLRDDLKAVCDAQVIVYGDDDARRIASVIKSATYQRPGKATSFDDESVEVLWRYLDLSEDPIVMCDEAGHVIRANVAARSWLGAQIDQPGSLRELLGASGWEELCAKRELASAEPVRLPFGQAGDAALLMIAHAGYRVLTRADASVIAEPIEEQSDAMKVERVMLVDDEVDILAVARISLERIGGWQVTTATSGAEALRLLEAETPDLMVLDMMMPDMDGMELFRRIRKDERHGRLPVIFMTAKTQRKEIEGYLSTGATGVINKPFDPMQLPGQIRSILNPDSGS